MKNNIKNALRPAATESERKTTVSCPTRLLQGYIYLTTSSIVAKGDVNHG